jgi:hypothetical protein
VDALLEAARAARRQAEKQAGEGGGNETADLGASSGEIARRALSLSQQGMQAKKRGDARTALARFEQARVRVRVRVRARVRARARVRVS